ncbi:MAG: sulfotransferase [Cyanobacteria bacterium P01_D01_bin.36]
MVNYLSKNEMVERVYRPNFFLEGTTQSSERIKSPVFLVGSERSGTTLLRLMLNSHPNMAFWTRFEYATELVDDEGSFPNLQTYYEWLQKNRNFLIDGALIDRSLDYPTLVNSFLRQFQSFNSEVSSERNHSEHQPIIGAIIHYHFDRLLHIWPNARFIHVLRDGRDVSRSCVKMGWAGDGWHGARRWVIAEKLWDEVKLKVPAERRVEVRFEQLIENTTATLDGVCQFMGERYHPDMMNYAIGTEYSLPDSSLVNQWHTKLSKREIQIIEARIAPLLVDRDYPLSGLPAIRVSKFDRALMKLKNKWGILSSRANKYGIPLTSADLIARQLKLEKWSDRINKKFSVIDSQRMKQSW